VVVICLSGDQTAQLLSMSEKEAAAPKDAAAAASNTTENKKAAKRPPPDLVIPKAKPKLSKAERRALQEQQRAAKAAARGQGAAAAAATTKDDSSNKKPASAASVAESSPRSTSSKHHHHPQGGAVASGLTSPSHPSSSPTLSHASKKQPAAAKKAPPGGTEAAAEAPPKQKTLSLVSHLPPYRDPDQTFDRGAQLKATFTGQHNLHPAVVELGYAYATGSIRGGNARCRAMLQCYGQVLEDFVPPNNKVAEDLRHTVDHQILKPAFQFWTTQCRPHSVSMGNAFSFLKTAVAALDREAAWCDMLSVLQETMAAYTRERIEFADQVIAETACQKLLADPTDCSCKPEVLLTYGHSEAVSVILQHAAALQKDFRVIVVDSPANEGRRLVRTLRACNVECSYLHLPALTYVLQDVSKVLLGAAALMSDGSVMGRVGSAVVALAAHHSHVPVLVCAETYKISNRVQLESITSNELGRPSDHVAAPPPDNSNNLGELNLLFDLTPASFVSGIVTELGIVPPSSVAVLLREMNPQELKSR